MNAKKAKRGSVGLVSTFTLIFIVLKIFHIISWSWIWVVSPIWISALVIAIIFSFILIVGRIKKGEW